MLLGFFVHKNRKLIKTLSKDVTLITFISLFCIGGASLLYQYQIYTNNVKLLKIENIEQKKKFLKDEVFQKATTIETQIEQIISSKNSELKKELIQLHLLLNNIYEHDIKTSATNEHVREHLTLFFTNNSFWKPNLFYYVIDNSIENSVIYHKNCEDTICNDVGLIESIKEKIENLPLKKGEATILNIKTEKNSDFNKEKSGFELRDKKDFLENQPQNKSENSSNITLAVIDFTPFKWILVAGFYNEIVDRDIVKKTAENVKNTPFFNDDYFYLIKTDGTILTNAGDSTTIGKNLKNYKDSNKINIFKETLKAIEIDKGGFIEYLWKKPNQKKEYPKITFVKKIKNRELVLGKGIYVDDLEQLIAEKKELLKNNITQFIIILTFISFIVSIFALFIISLLSKKFIKNFDAFIDFFEKSSLKSKEINPENLFFDEFKVLANSANFMIKQQKENEMLFKLFVEQSKDGVMIIDEKGVIIECNQIILDVMDFERDNILFKEIWEIQSERVPLIQKTPHLANQIKMILEDFFKNIQNEITEHPIEQRLQRRDGSIRVIQSVVFPIKMGDRTLIGSIIRDITDQKQVEKDLIAEKERLAVTLKSIKDGVIVTNTEYLVVSMNPSAERLTGWKQIESVGKNLNQIFRIFFQESDNQISETILVDKNGGRKIITDSFAPIYDNRGKILGTILVFQDITERHKINFERQKMQKLESIGILAGKIAHDFNNLLTGILGYINLAKVSNSEEDITQNLQKAEETTLSAQKISNQFLTFSRGGEPVKKGCNFFTIVNDALNSTEFEGIELFFISNIKEIPILGDEHQILQMLKELFFNAKESMPNGGKLTISIARVVAPIDITINEDSGDNYALLSIKDSGNGMSESVKKRVFEPYFTTKDKKNGLGLTIVESILIQHNGKIEIHSKEGAGTLVQLFIPLNIKNSKNSEENDDDFNNRVNKNEFNQNFTNKNSINRSSENSDFININKDNNGSLDIKKESNKILIMDDEEMILKLSSKMLKHLGYEADCVRNGEEAIEFYKKSLEENRVYLGVILDLTIVDGLGGLKTVEELLKLNPKLKAIVSSGYSNDSANAHHKEIGFSGYLPKPYKINQLSEVIESILKSKLE